MFGNLLGNFEEKQDAMRAKLKEMVFEYDFQDGAIIVTANASREILNIAINPDKVDLSDKEQVEDMMLEAINRTLEEAAIKEASEMQQSIKDILPGGMGGLGDLFK